MDGVEKLLKQLDDVKLIESQLMTIMDDCGVFVRDDARLRVPVDTGDLRKSIQHSTRRREDGIETVVHTNSDHAAHVEFGTGPVGAADHAGVSPNVQPMYKQEKWLGVIPFLKSDTDSGLRYIAGQKAQPYLYPALKDNEEQLARYMAMEIQKAIRRKVNG